MLDSPHSQVRFYDENENEAILMLHEDRAVARVANGDNMLAKLPASYRTYDIRYESANATATATADLDAILSWKLARQISVKDHSDVAIDMMRRYKELRNLAMLHKLTLVVQRHSYKRLFVRQFLNHVSQLSEVEFVAGEGMTREALQEFVDQQEPPYAYEALLAGDRVIYKNAFYWSAAKIKVWKKFSFCFHFSHNKLWYNRFLCSTQIRSWLFPTIQPTLVLFHPPANKIIFPNLNRNPIKFFSICINILCWNGG